MILVDSAESSASLLSYPPLDRLGAACRLPSTPHSDARADVYFDGCGPDGAIVRIGIEVKEVRELAAALDTGRFQATQLPAMLELYDVRWLVVVTGSHRRNPSTGALQTLRTIKVDGKMQKVWLDFMLGTRTVQFSYVHRFLASPAFTQYKDENGEGIRTHMVYSEREAAEWIGDLYDIWQRPYESHKSMQVLDRSGNRNGLTENAVRTRLRSLHDARLDDPKFAQRVRTASSLPGVSYTRAIGLASQFNSVQKMISPACVCEVTEERCRLEEKEWSKADKIGKIIAKDIGRAVR